MLEQLLIQIYSFIRIDKPQMSKRAPIVKHEDQHCARLSIALASLALTQSYPRRLLELELGMTVAAMDRIYAFSD